MGSGVLKFKNQSTESLRVVLQNGVSPVRSEFVGTIESIASTADILGWPRSFWIYTCGFTYLGEE